MNVNNVADYGYNRIRAKISLYPTFLKVIQEGFSGRMETGGSEEDLIEHQRHPNRCRRNIDFLERGLKRRINKSFLALHLDTWYP
jgi:hypothetical protein